MSDEATAMIKESVMRSITILETQGESSLIEWQEKIKYGKKDVMIPRRGYVQNDSMEGDMCLADVLAYALPVGPDPMALDLHKFTERLRLRNVWTRADFRQKAKAVIRSLLEAMEVK